MDEASPGYNAAQALRSGDRAAVRHALVAARERTLAIADAYAAALEPAGMRVPYAPTLNPPLWELGHVGWFQEYWIGRNRERDRGIGCDPAHARGPSLLHGADSLYDSGTVAHRSRWELPLPDAAATRRYLAGALAQTLELLEQLPRNPGDPELYFFRLAALHEEMHAEAACYMARALGVPLAAKPIAPARVPRQAEVEVPAQAFRLGYDGPGFAFDNELGSHEVHLEAFKIDAQPVTWARFLAFAEAGGYEQQRWWSEPGWAWLRQSGRPDHETQAHDPDEAAVHLSAHEAQAWCRWAGRRLPTEAQWECAALTVSGFTWGQVWEWTASAFQPYPGFKPHPYRDYSAPWFGSRTVLRGACPATSAALAHPRYRNFFEPHRCDVFAGFRSCA
jgi:gamma-glutamyl hercynylcysteine S-oxide synthase